jgi:Protein of unknown function (DUF2934)
MPEKQTKPAQKRSTAPRRRSKKAQPAHSHIAERAYFIHLENGSSDSLENWLRAERELKAA